MRHFFLFLFVLLGITACDDGDTISTTFNFDAIELEVCGDVGDYVFYKINNENLETLSFQLKTQDSILFKEDTISFNIDNSTHRVNYRTYGSEISASYFCNLIPPTTPSVVLNYESSQGEATLITRITDTVPNNKDTSFVYTTSIRLTNLRLETQNETITQETLNLGSINTTF